MSSLLASVTVVAVNAPNHCPASTLHCRSLFIRHRSLTLRDQNLMARVLTIVVHIDPVTPVVAVVLRELAGNTAIDS